MKKGEKEAALKVVNPEEATTEEITPHTELITLEDRINQELQKFDFPKEKIASIKRKNQALKINGIEDIKGYKAVEVAQKELWRIDVNIEKKRKELKADGLAIGRAIDSRATELSTLVKEGRGGRVDLEAMLDVIDLEKKQIAEKARQEEEARVNSRVEKLLANGLTFDGQFYSLEDISLDLLAIKEMPEARFTQLIKKAFEVKAKLDQAAKEKEEAELAERNRQAELTLANEKKQKELDEREANLKKQIYEGRVRILNGLGLVNGATPEGLVYDYGNKAGSVTILHSEVEELSDNDFNDRITAISKKVNELAEEFNQMVKNEEAEKQEEIRLAARNEVRKANLEGKGWLYNEKESRFEFKSPYSTTIKCVDEATVYAVLDDKFTIYLKDLIVIASEFVEAEKTKKEDATKLAEENRLAGLNDQQLAKEYVDKILEVLPTPLFKTDEAIKAGTEFHDAVIGKITSLLGIFRD